MTNNKEHTFNNVCGQETVVEMLRNTLCNDQISNMIFYGMPGSGKTSAITALCREYYGNNFFDCVLDLNTYDMGINSIRADVKNFASTRSYTGKKKVIVLDEVDNITIDAQYALRRIIEKYSCNTRFVLVCVKMHKIISSIYSRCIIIKFEPIQRDKAICFLRNTCSTSSNNNSVNDEDLGILYDLSGRDIRSCILYIRSGAIPCIDNIYRYFYCTTEKSIAKLRDVISSSCRDSLKYRDAIMQSWSHDSHMHPMFKAFFDIFIDLGMYQCIIHLSEVEKMYVRMNNCSRQFFVDYLCIILTNA